MGGSERLNSTDLVVITSYFVTITLKSENFNYGVTHPCIYNGEDDFTHEPELEEE